MSVEDDKDLEAFRQLLEDNVKGILEEIRRLSEDDDVHGHDDHDGNHAGPSVPGQDAPGRYYRDLARDEAVRKRHAYEASKRAYKMGQGAEARRVSIAKYDSLHSTNSWNLA